VEGGRGRKRVRARVHAREIYMERQRERKGGRMSLGRRIPVSKETYTSVKRDLH
jgi:hypothetical protein